MLRDRAGAVAVLVALASIPIAASAALAVDLGLAYVVRSRLITAIDAAALAGTRSINAPTRDAEIAAWFWANYGRAEVSRNVGWLGTEIEGPVITVEDEGRQVRVSVRARVPTVFMRLFGQDSLSVGVENVARRAELGMELALVLDITGSMKGGNAIAALRDAATELVNILYDGRETVNNLWVAVVPYVASVNLGPTRSAWLVPGSLNPNAYLNRSWAGCVEARHANGHDGTDATPAEVPFRPYLWTSTRNKYSVKGDNDWTATTITEQNQASLPDNTAVGPNLGCGAPVLPLTTARTTILGRIAALQATFRGGTMANLGLQAGWFTLSPRWRGLWGDPNLPIAYNDELIRKVVVLMTDGENQWYDWPGGAPGSGPGGWSDDHDADYTAYGRIRENRLGLTGSASGWRGANGRAAQEINARMTGLCTAMKAQNIMIYTVVFNVSANSPAQALYRGCATSPQNYFNSPTQADLRAAFRAIGEQLANLRLTQ
ncbi:MAG: Flp pilus assembly protein TadG [Acetobacteraceae bacterium]|nr:Flp pilus assembly protein TadG [Acetobacteraceae bacterium]